MLGYCSECGDYIAEGYICHYHVMSMLSKCIIKLFWHFRNYYDTTLSSGVSLSFCNFGLLNYRICSVICALFSSILAAEKSVCVKYADFFFVEVFAFYSSIILFTSLYLTSLYPVLFAPFVYAPWTPVHFYGVGLFFVVPGTPIFPLFNAFCLYKSIFKADNFCFTTVLQVLNAYLNRLY